METNLSQQRIDELVEAAKQARLNAYAPYSQFSVGAALLGNDGKIYPGCNIENGSLGLTLCAERVAISSAVASGCRSFQVMAVFADTDETPVTPCGACRQVLAEFNPVLTIICASDPGQIRVMRLDELLPHHFEFGLR